MLNASAGRNFNRLSYDNYAWRAALDPRRINHLSLSLRPALLAPSRDLQRFPGIHLLRINQCVKLITASRGPVTRVARSRGGGEEEVLGMGGGGWEKRTVLSGKRSLRSLVRAEGCVLRGFRWLACYRLCAQGGFECLA